MGSGRMRLRMSDPVQPLSKYWWPNDDTARVLNIHRSGVLTALFGCYMAGAVTLEACGLCV